MTEPMTNEASPAAAELLPVAWRYRGPRGGWITVETRPPSNYDGLQPLYTAPTSDTKLKERIAELERDLSKAQRIATDRAYMLEVYYAMLSETGALLADRWKADGLLRMHISWGPDASKMTGEERARYILGVEHAPKTRVLSFDDDEPARTALSNAKEG